MGVVHLNRTSDHSVTSLLVELYKQMTDRLTIRTDRLTDKTNRLKDRTDRLTDRTDRLTDRTD